MANSAIRIPIPGSIIDAVGAEAGDLLTFDPNVGQGGSFVNFRPLIQDLRPFTKNSVLDFYVSVKSQSETSIWSDATAKGMSLAAALDSSGLPVVDDMRLGINLSSGRPTHTLEVVGDIMVWGNGVEAGDVVGRLKFFRGADGTGGGDTTTANLIFNTPLANSTDSELDALQSSLRNGRLLLRHPVSKDTFFARLEDILTPGSGIQITDNTVSLGEISELTSATGFTVRMDSDESGGESEAFRVVESVNISTGAVDFPLLRLVRGHQSVVDWVGGQFQLGLNGSQQWPTVKFGVGTGSRFLPGGMVIEDGAPVTAGDGTQEGYASGGSGGSYYARLFGAVAANPADIILTGTAGNPNSAFYYDAGNSQAATSVNGSGRFGFLPGIVTMANGGIANPGSFVSGFLNKHQDGGGVKIKACDTNGDEFALFMENGEVSYVTGATGGAITQLEARHYAIAEDVTIVNPTDQYQNILASHAPVFSVRATTGDTFVRGFMVMPFMPGINSDIDGNPTVNGVSSSDVVYSTSVDTGTNVVTMKKFQWDPTAMGGAGLWVLAAAFTLPKGTLYSDANGNVKIARGGQHIPNHGLNGITSWFNSQ